MSTMLAPNLVSRDISILSARQLPSERLLAHRLGNALTLSITRSPVTHTVVANAIHVDPSRLPYGCVAYQERSTITHELGSLPLHIEAQFPMTRIRTFRSGSGEFAKLTNVHTLDISQSLRRDLLEVESTFMRCFTQTQCLPGVSFKKTSDGTKASVSFYWWTPQNSSKSTTSRST